MSKLEELYKKGKGNLNTLSFDQLFELLVEAENYRRACHRISQTKGDTIIGEKMMVEIINRITNKICNQ